MKTRFSLILPTYFGFSMFLILPTIQKNFERKFKNFWENQENFFSLDKNFSENIRKLEQEN